MISGFENDTTGSPPGFIQVWTGSLSNIPDGWALCDGNNGTPNLIDRSIKGVPDTSTDPGATGGQNSFTLATSQLPSHSHSHSNTSTDGSHSHTIDYDGTKNGFDYSLDAPDSTGGSTVTTYNAGGHSHSLSVGTTGSDGSITNRPPYYRVAFIQKL